MSNIDSTPNNLSLWGYDNYADLEQAIQEMRDAIEEALTFIRQQEDGPLTMTFSLRGIGERLTVIENEAEYLHGTAERFHTLAQKFLVQRDAALKQRDILIEADRQRKQHDDDEGLAQLGDELGL
jgi:hypothetical protein